jgi:hypothetical protein
VDQMLWTSQRSIAQGEALSFDQGLLPVNELGDVQAGVVFDFKSLYPQYQEFQNPDALRLQQSTAELSRHNQQLQARVDQLQAELGEAHQIFEQIQQHPIAGPILRGRQRMLDWWRRRRGMDVSSGSEHVPS